jgi:hypothetical protein
MKGALNEYAPLLDTYAPIYTDVEEAFYLLCQFHIGDANEIRTYAPIYTDVEEAFYLLCQFHIGDANEIRWVRTSFN